MKKIINDIDEVIKFDTKDVKSITLAQNKVGDRLVYQVNLNLGEIGNDLGMYATDTRAKVILKEVEAFVANKDKEFTIPKM